MTGTNHSESFLLGGGGGAGGGEQPSLIPRSDPNKRINLPAGTLGARPRRGSDGQGYARHMVGAR